MRVSRASEMTIPSATGSAPPERPVPAPRATNGIALLVAEPDDRLHLLDAAGQRDERGHHAATRQAVALVRPQLLRLADRLGDGGEPVEHVRPHRNESLDPY